ncbi:MAG: hypothetical protein GY909_15275 [Oligoflexia bacterium]|nr:hypothetical protein [Oligoflexia bacterium]
MKKNTIFTFSLLVSLIFLSSCLGGSKGSEEGSSSACTNCANTPSLPARDLKITMLSTSYYSHLHNSWVDIEASESNFMDLGTHELMSDDIAKPLSESLSMAEQSIFQKSNPSLFEEDSLSGVMYLMFEWEKGDSFLVNYIKEGPLGPSNILEEINFVPEVRSNRVMVPINNEQFQNRFLSQSVSDVNSASLTHRIKIVKTSTSSSKTSEVKEIVLRVRPIPRPTGLDVEYSQAMQNFNLQNRWEYYFNGVDYSPNRDLDFVSLIDNRLSSEPRSYDVKFVFKQEPKIIMRQTIFSEEVIDLELHKNTREINVSRGTSFLEKSNILDSSKDFRKKLKINDLVVDFVNEREGVLRNIPAFERFKLTFTIDLLKNQAYDPTTELLTPLRPECQIISKNVFYPLQLKEQIDILESEGGKGYYCHPDTNKKELIASNDVSTSPLVDKDDLWHHFFAYRPYQVIHNSAQKTYIDAGHFYGIKDVEFSVSGCLKIYIREASSLETNPNIWERVSGEDNECSDSSDEGWVYFDISKGDDIFTHALNMDEGSDIRSLIDAMGLVQKRSVSPFIFNGSEKIDKIY